MSIQQYDPSLAARVIQDGTYYEGCWPYRTVEPPPPQPLESPQLGVQRVHYMKRPPASVRILEALEASPCTFTQIARYVRGSSQFCRAILEPMVADGRVVRWEIAPRQGTRGKPQVMYRLAAKEDV